MAPVPMAEEPLAVETRRPSGPALTSASKVEEAGTTMMTRSQVRKTVVRRRKPQEKAEEGGVEEGGDPKLAGAGGEEVATVVAGVTEMASAREEETAAPSGTMKAEPNLILSVTTTVIITLPFVLPRYANAVEKIARK